MKGNMFETWFVDSQEISLSQKAITHFKTFINDQGICNTVVPTNDSG